MTITLGAAQPPYHADRGAHDDPVRPETLDNHSASHPKGIVVNRQAFGGQNYDIDVEILTQLDHKKAQDASRHDVMLACYHQYSKLNKL